MFRSFVLSTVSAILVCGPAFAGGMSATSGSYSGGMSRSSSSMGNTSTPIQSGFSSGTTTTGGSSRPVYRPRPVARPVTPGLRFLNQNPIGYSVYSNGRTLYIRGLTQTMVERYQIKLGTLVNNLMTAYPGHQLVQLF